MAIHQPSMDSTNCTLWVKKEFIKLGGKESMGGVATVSRSMNLIKAEYTKILKALIKKRKTISSWCITSEYKN